MDFERARITPPQFMQTIKYMICIICKKIGNSFFLNKSKSIHNTNFSHFLSYFKKGTNEVNNNKKFSPFLLYKKKKLKNLKKKWENFP